MDKAIVTFNGDLHCNSTLGLCPPKITLDDGGTARHSKAQKWTWGKWLSYWDEVKQLKAQHKCPVISVLNGELLDDNKHATTQVHSRNKADMLYLAGQVLRPMLEISDKVYVTRGTEAHVGASGELDEIVAKDIGAQKDGERHSWWWLPLNVCNTKFDIAHHPGVGSARPWTRGNPAQVVASRVMFDHYEAGTMYRPDLVIRSHNHLYSDSYKNFPIRAIIMPPWQLTTAFGRRLGYNGTVEPVGGVIAVCELGREPEITVRRYAPKARGYVKEEIA